MVNKRTIMVKKRTIEEYRQVKDSVYIPPKSHKINSFMKTFGQELYSVLFHYNHYQEKWFCFKSDQKREYFNGDNSIVGTGKDPEAAFQNLLSKKS